MWKATLIFLLDAGIDWVWAKYNIACADRRPLQASTLAAIIISIGSVSTLMFVHDNWLILPGAAGAFVGTYIAVKRNAA